MIVMPYHKKPASSSPDACTCWGCKHQHSARVCSCDETRLSDRPDNIIKLLASSLIHSSTKQGIETCMNHKSQLLCSIGHAGFIDYSFISGAREACKTHNCSAALVRYSRPAVYKARPIAPLSRNARGITCAEDKCMEWLALRTAVKTWSDAHER